MSKLTLTNAEREMVDRLVPAIDEAINQTGIVKFPTGRGRESARQSIYRRVITRVVKWSRRTGGELPLDSETDRGVILRTMVRAAGRDVYRSAGCELKRQKEHLGGPIAQFPVDDDGRTHEPTDTAQEPAFSPDDYRQLIVVLHDRGVLSDEQRRLLHCLAKSGSIKQTAKALGVSRQAVEKRLKTVKRRLAKAS